MAATAVTLLEAPRAVPQKGWHKNLREDPPDTPLDAARSLHANGRLLQAAEAYRKCLTANPGSQAALLGLSLVARQSGQLLPALRMAQAAVSVNPASALAHTTLAHCFQALRDLAQAEKHFRSALRLNSFGLPAILGLAELLTATNRLVPAEDLLRRALAINPNHPAIHFGLGNILTLNEQYPAALASFQHALALEGIHAHTTQTGANHHFAIAYVYARLGKHPQAIHHYRKALKLRPGFAAAWVNLGVSLVSDGRDLLAEPCYEQALSADPGNLSAHLNLGNLERSRKRFPQAGEHYNRALALQPGSSELHVAFAYFHLEQGDFTQARLSLETALECDTRDRLAANRANSWPIIRNPRTNAGPANPEIPNARGILLLAQAAANRCPATIPAAIEAFSQAEALGHKTAASNRGNALLRLGRVEQALAAHQTAVAADPNHPGARYNLALTQLRTGDYAHGWPNYEARWSFREVHPRPRRFIQPRWQGQSLLSLQPANRRLFIYSEQGLGDTLQFVRYLPRVAELGAEIILEVQPPLARLLKPLVESLGGTLLVHGDPLPDFAFQSPLLSLPAIFATTLETVPNRIPYLKADPARIKIRAREHGLQSGISPGSIANIGLAWAGNPKYPSDRDRSTHLGTFLPLLQAFPDIRFLSLQKGDAARQVHSLPAELAPLNASSCDLDLAATAALIANLDLVISTDTAIAHLAGALGKPLWLLLPWQSDWRWMQETLTTLWYPQARLFRQSSAGDWDELIERVIAALTRPSFFARPLENRS